MVLIRRNVGGPASFPSEFFIEDFILLLAVAVVLLPARFGPLVSSLVSCSICILLVLMASSTRSHKLLLPETIFIALIGIYSASRAVIDASRLWRNRNGLQ
jgi:large-conductance mechanosensitive channel